MITKLSGEEGQQCGQSRRFPLQKLRFFLLVEYQRMTTRLWVAKDRWEKVDNFLFYGSLLLMYWNKLLLIFRQDIKVPIKGHRYLYRLWNQYKAKKFMYLPVSNGSTKNITLLNNVSYVCTRKFCEKVCKCEV